MDGTLTPLDDRHWQLRFERELAHPVEKVWRAVTEPAHLAAWFPTTIEGERERGAALRFSFPNGEAPSFDGEMLTYEPPRLLEFRWGVDIIRLELIPAGDATMLILSDTFDEQGKAARDGAGWHTCLDALALHLGGDPDPRRALGGWNEVHPRYVERFGPAASTIDPPEGLSI